jgi:hypothetical protein
MANDRQVIQYMSPAELVGLMNAAGVVTVHETVMSDGKPVIHAAVNVANAETGEKLPGGLPFSVVMFKGPNEPGYSNIAIGTIVPASELKVVLPRDYFNFCNQRFRFTRVFPVDEKSFVIQMDLVLKNATREYVKFSFGLWGALFSQMLFELMGRGRESLIAAAQAYAEAHTDFSQQIATAPDAAIAEPVAAELPVAVPAETVTDLPADTDAVLPLDAEAIIPVEIELPAANEVADEVPAEETVEATVEIVTADKPAEEIVAEQETSDVPAEILVEPSEAPAEAAAEAAVEEAVEPVGEPELSIAAGPTVEPTPEADIVVHAAEVTEPAGEHEEAKELEPA